MCRRNKGGFDEPPSFDLCGKVEDEMDRIYKEIEIPENRDEETNDTFAFLQAIVRDGEASDEDGAIIELAIKRVHKTDTEPMTRGEWLADNEEPWEREEARERYRDHHDEEDL